MIRYIIVLLGFVLLAGCGSMTMSSGGPEYRCTNYGSFSRCRPTSAIININKSDEQWQAEQNAPSYRCYHYNGFSRCRPD